MKLILQLSLLTISILSAFVIATQLVLVCRTQCEVDKSCRKRIGAFLDALGKWSAMGNGAFDGFTPP